jgi:hypothetical protein
MDWKQWHTRYDEPDSPFARRLEEVRGRIADALDRAGPGPLRAVSLCAGEARDLIPVLAAHPRGRDVRARLVELDPQLAERARESARQAGLAGVEVVTGDAAEIGHYLELAPADLVLVCGLYGNITVADVERTVGACAGLCARGGTVVWTRGRDRSSVTVDLIRGWYARDGFEELYGSTEQARLYVGAHRQSREPAAPPPAGTRLFEFVGYDALAATAAGAGTA